MATETVATEAEIQDRIIAHLGLAKAVALRTVDPRCVGADREDLLAWGVVGLVQAAGRYRPEEGASFGSYAARRIRGQVLDALRASDPLTRSARRAYRQARAIREDLPPPYAEISLERMLEGGREPSEATRPVTPPDGRWNSVAAALLELSAEERRALVLSYGRGLTLREIGRVFGLSESGACRLRARALAKVRRALASAGPDSLAAAGPPSTVRECPGVKHPQGEVRAAGAPGTG